jgi:hypothetical protein
MVQAVFPSFIRQRAAFVLETLRKAPELQKVTFEWHDSINDDLSEGFKGEILMDFLGLPAEIIATEHYLKEGETPDKRSTIGRKRIEFQQIVDGGMSLY